VHPLWGKRKVNDEKRQGGEMNGIVAKGESSVLTGDLTRLVVLGVKEEGGGFGAWRSISGS